MMRCTQLDNGVRFNPLDIVKKQRISVWRSESGNTERIRFIVNLRRDEDVGWVGGSFSVAQDTSAFTLAQTPSERGLGDWI